MAESHERNVVKVEFTSAGQVTPSSATSAFVRSFENWIEEVSWVAIELTKLPDFFALEHLAKSLWRDGETRGAALLLARFGFQPLCASSWWRL
jgi:hypothetical protein